MHATGSPCSSATSIPLGSASWKHGPSWRPGFQPSRLAQSKNSRISSRATARTRNGSSAWHGLDGFTALLRCSLHPARVELPLVLRVAVPECELVALEREVLR